MISVVDIGVINNPGELVERVKAAFLELGYPQLTGITCEAEHSTIYLSGLLRSYYLKQVAQTISLKVPGVRHVVNDIEIAPDW